jgi:mRNA interferase MazF
MAEQIARGGIWLCDFVPPDKRRPVVVLTRDRVIKHLTTVLVAPVTSTIHGIDSEVAIGVEEGLKHPSVVNLDHVQTVSKARLSKHVGQVGAEKMRVVCAALGIATGCEGQRGGTTS